MADDSTSLLQQLGFTAYEARAWLALVGARGLTGYEVAKRSGIPRANVYPVLKKLVERDAVRRIDTAAGVRYRATPAPELLAGMRREQDRLLATAEVVLPRQAEGADDQPVFALASVAQVLANARRLIGATRRALCIAVQPLEAALLAADLGDANARGVAITTLCMEACPADCGACCGNIFRCAREAGNSDRWLLIVGDERAAVAAAFGVGGGVRAIETHQPLVVELIASYIRQSAALAVLGDELGDRFEGLLSLQAHLLLDGLQSHGGFPGREVQAATPEAAPSGPATGHHQES